VEWDGLQYELLNPRVLGTDLEVKGYGESEKRNSTATGDLTGVIEGSRSTDNTGSSIPRITTQHMTDLHLTNGNVYKTITALGGIVI